MPTIDFMVNSSLPGADPHGPPRERDQPAAMAVAGALTDSSAPSDSDDTVTDDDGDYVTSDELVQCATHVHTLLKRILLLQQSLGAESNRRFPRNRVHKLYRRFCRKFESNMVIHHESTSAATSMPELTPPSQDLAPKPQPVTPKARTEVPRLSTAISDSAPPQPTQDDAQAHPTLQDVHHPHRIHTPRSAPDTPYATASPAYTISSEPLGRGNHRQLPPLSSTIPSAVRFDTANEIRSPSHGKDSKENSLELEGEAGQSENGPVVYTKTGRISKAKKGLKVHVCEECGRVRSMHFPSKYTGADNSLVVYQG